MSSEFQHTLHGKGMSDTFAGAYFITCRVQWSCYLPFHVSIDVAFGSTITIRHVNTQGGYLHSHPHNYPGGSKQQQITLYPHMDSNNDWKIVPMLDPNKQDAANATDPLKTLTYLTPGSVFRLQHARTGKHLHSHDVRPPVSEVDFQQEVSGYGFDGFEGDANDNFILEIDEEGGWCFAFFPSLHGCSLVLFFLGLIVCPLFRWRGQRRPEREWKGLGW